MALTVKQELFVSEYLKCRNATQAAIAAGYSKKSAHSIGNENLSKPEIASRVRERTEAVAMEADEVLRRLAEHARGDIADLIDPATMALDWNKAVANGSTRLIRKVKQTTITRDDQDTHILEFEMYDAQAALVHLGKQLGMFANKMDITSGGEPVQVVFNQVPARAEPPG